MSTDVQLHQSPKQAKGTALAQYLGSPAMTKRLQQALPRHMTPDRMIRMALTAATRTPKLLNCSLESIGLALLQASQFGVEVNGRDAHLVPYGDQCQLIVDYKGMIQLAYRSGIVDGVSAKAVYERDLFEYELGSDEHLKHVPCTEDDPGKLVYAWAMVRFKGGGNKFVVLNRRDIKRRMEKSQTAKRSDSPWQQHPEAMWAKSAVKELAKWMPQVPEMDAFHNAVADDDAKEYGAVTLDVQPIETPPSKSEQLAQQMRERNGNGASHQQEEDPPFNPPTAEEMAQVEADEAAAKEGPTLEREPAADQMKIDARVREYVEDIIPNLEVEMSLLNYEKQAREDPVLAKSPAAIERVLLAVAVKRQQLNQERGSKRKR